jgi:asparagine synthetase B (glutamine-hydrolysing)
MCGIFYIIYLTNKYKNNLVENNLDNIIDKIKYRGPDYINIIKDNNIYMVHTLLAIQGFHPQPYKTNNGYIIFNGEIYGTSKVNELNYNYIPTTFKSECDFLENFLEKSNGYIKIDELDGEFIINHIDIKNNILNIITDPFYTKPFCYYRNNDIFIGSTYESCIINTLNILNITGKTIFLKPNIHYIFDLSTCILQCENEIIKWDFNPKFNNFDRWNIAYENSIIKRTNTDKGIFVPLSSGYDSGCIVSSLLKLNKNFKTYTFKGKEDINTLEKRKLLIEKKNKFYYINPKENIEEKYKEYFNRIENYTAYNINGEPYSNIYDAWSCFGIYQIFQRARKDNMVIFLSGHGGDEIFSDYGNETNKTASILELNYTNVRSKWPNFDSGYGRNIIQMFERVAGCYGIEARYPFLDKHVVQEFLWLNDTLKNKEFKQCLSQYMKLNKFPYLENKKCSVAVITEKDGGNDYFLNITFKIKKEYNYVEPIYKNTTIINKKIYRPNGLYKPIINYYP